MLDSFATASTLLRAAVSDVRRALDPLSPFPPEIDTEADLTGLLESPQFAAFTESLHELSGLLKYATLALCLATEPALADGASRLAVRSIHTQASNAHRHTYRANMVLWDVAAKIAQLSSP